MSQLTTITFFFCCSLRKRESLATLVVLPEPCKPAMRMTAGGCAARLRLSLASPMTRTSSSLTIFTSTCPGVRLLSTASPVAFSRIESMNSRTTGKATSASSSAIRISRRVSLMFCSVRRPRPRTRSSESPRRLLRLLNMVFFRRVRKKIWSKYT